MHILKYARPLGCVSLGGIWIFAAMAKMQHLDALAAELGARGSIGWILAAALVSAEFCLGVSLILSYLRHTAHLGTTFLLAVFLVFEGARKHPSGCSCFGETGKYLGLDRFPIYRDIALLVVSFGLYVSLRPWSGTGATIDKQGFSQ